VRLFFFGSLMDRDLLALVLGRPLDGLMLSSAALHGFERRRAQGETFPVLAPHPGGRVDGLLVQGLGWGDVDRVHYFESADYALHPFRVEHAAGRLEAFVFLPTQALQPEDTAWDFDAWSAAERGLAFALAEELMACYGRLTTAELDALWPEMKQRAQRRFRRALRRRSA
jgi:hypothetical protein